MRSISRRIIASNHRPSQDAARNLERQLQNLPPKGARDAKRVRTWPLFALLALFRGQSRPMPLPVGLRILDLGPTPSATVPICKVAFMWLSCGFKVALRWLYGAYPLAINTPWGGFGWLVTFLSIFCLLLCFRRSSVVSSLWFPAPCAFCLARLWSWVASSAYCRSFCILRSSLCIPPCVASPTLLPPRTCQARVNEIRSAHEHAGTTARRDQAST